MATPKTTLKIEVNTTEAIKGLNIFSNQINESIAKINEYKSKMRGGFRFSYIAQEEIKAMQSSANAYTYTIQKVIDENKKLEMQMAELEKSGAITEKTPLSEKYRKLEQYQQVIEIQENQMRNEELLQGKIEERQRQYQIANKEAINQSKLAKDEILLEYKTYQEKEKEKRLWIEKTSADKISNIRKEAAIQKDIDSIELAFEKAKIKEEERLKKEQARLEKENAMLYKKYLKEEQEIQEKINNDIAMQNKSLEGQMTPLQRIEKGWLRITLATYLAQRGITILWDLMKESSAIDSMRSSFDRNMKVMGASAEQLMYRMKKASAGTMTEFDLQKSVSRAIAYKIPLEKMTLLMEIARAKSKEMGLSISESFQRITEGIGKQEQQIIDDLGINLRLNDAYREYVAIHNQMDKAHKIKASNLSEAQRQEAILNFVINHSTTSLQNQGKAADDINVKFQQLEVQINSFKMVLVGGLKNALSFVIAEWEHLKWSMDLAFATLSYGLARILAPTIMVGLSALAGAIIAVRNALGGFIFAWAAGGGAVAIETAASSIMNIGSALGILGSITAGGVLTAGLGYVLYQIYEIGKQAMETRNRIEDFKMSIYTLGSDRKAALEDEKRSLDEQVKIFTEKKKELESKYIEMGKKIPENIQPFSKESPLGNTILGDIITFGKEIKKGYKEIALGTHQFLDRDLRNVNRSLDEMLEKQKAVNEALRTIGKTPKPYKTTDIPTIDDDKKKKAASDIEWLRTEMAKLEAERKHLKATTTGFNSQLFGEAYEAAEAYRIDTQAFTDSLTEKILSIEEAYDKELIEIKNHNKGKGALQLQEKLNTQALYKALDKIMEAELDTYKDINEKIKQEDKKRLEESKEFLYAMSLAEFNNRTENELEKSKKIWNSFWEGIINISLVDEKLGKIEQITAKYKKLREEIHFIIKGSKLDIQLLTKETEELAKAKAEQAKYLEDIFGIKKSPMKQFQEEWKNKKTAYADIYGMTPEMENKFEEQEKIAKQELLLSQQYDMAQSYQSGMAEQQKYWFDMALSNADKYLKLDLEKRKGNHIKKTEMIRAEADFTISMLGLMFSANDKYNKKMFQIQKAYAIVTGTMDAFGAYTKSMEEHANPVIAAAMLALTLAGVAMIAKQKYTGSESSISGAGVGGSISAPTMPTETKPTSVTNQPIVNVHIYGNLIDDKKYARDLIPSIIQGVQDGVKSKDGQRIVISR